MANQQNIKTVEELANHVDNIAGQVAAIAAIISHIPAVSAIDKKSLLDLARQLSPQPLPKQFTVGSPELSATAMLETVQTNALRLAAGKQ